MHRRIVALAVVLIAGFVLAGCGSEDTGGTVAEPPTTTADGGATTAPGVTTTAPGGATTAEKVEVKTAKFVFEPATIQLTAGEDVQFVITNADQAEHSLTVDGLNVDQDVEGGKSAEAPVTKSLQTGTYPFRCKYHPAMKGTITVA